MNDPLAGLLKGLAEAGVHLDPENARDALWLALRRTAPGPAPVVRPGSAEPLPEREEPTQDDSSPGPGTSRAESTAPPKESEDRRSEADRDPPGSRSASATPERSDYSWVSASTATAVRKVALPVARALPGARSLARALRPLRRDVPAPVGSALQFDEAATVRRIADEGMWVPVFRPPRERWLEVALVVDASYSMWQWRRAVHEFERTLRYSGSFRMVSTWWLDTEADKPRLYARDEDVVTDVRRRRLNEVTGPGTRRIVLVVSDCVSSAWNDGKVLGPLLDWSHTTPVALVQVLPERLWDRTWLGDWVPVDVRSVSAAPPNAGISWRPNQPWLDPRVEFEESNRNRQVVLPVAGLDAGLLNRLARMMAGENADWTRGYYLDLDDQLQTRGAERTVRGASPTGSERVERFFSVASPPARDLASLLAAAPVLTPGLVSLIRRELLPDSGQAHEAEVVLGGLLRARTRSGVDPREDTTTLTFHDGVRERLLAAGRAFGTLEVLKLAARTLDDIEVERDTFTAWIEDPTASEGSIVVSAPGAVEVEGHVESVESFLEGAANVLGFLGGAHARLVRPAASPEPAEEPVPESEPPEKGAAPAESASDVVATTDPSQEDGRNWRIVKVSATETGGLRFVNDVGDTMHTMDAGAVKQIERRLAEAKAQGTGVLDLGRRAFEPLFTSALNQLWKAPDGVVLELDPFAARLPWELFQPPGPSRPKHALLRRFPDMPKAPSGSDELYRSALVIGQAEGRSGASAQEIEVVSHELEAAFDVTPMYWPGPDDITKALYARPYRAIHVWGRSAYFGTGQGEQGESLGGGFWQTLSRQVAVPELVFLQLDRRPGDPVVRGPATQTVGVEFLEQLAQHGVRAIVVAQLPVTPDASHHFAQVLYRELIAGRALGIAVTRARESIHGRWQESWASFQVYGDPEYQLVSDQWEIRAFADELVDKGQSDRAVDVLIRLAERFEREGDPDASTARADAARVLQRLRRFDQAVPLMKQALKLSRDTEWEAIHRRDLIYLLDEAGRSEQALNEIETGLDDSAADDPSEQIDLLRQRGELLERMNRSEEAETAFRSAVESANRHFDARAGADAAVALARFLSGSGRPEESLQYYEQAVGAWESLDDRRGIAYARQGQSLALIELGDFQSALVMSEEQLQIARAKEDQHLLADLLGVLAQIHVRAGDPHAAIEPAQERVSVERSAEPPNSSLVSYALADLARIQAMVGDLDGARAASDEMLSLSGLGNWTDHALALTTRAEILEDSGDLDEARDAASDAVDLYVSHEDWRMATRAASRLRRLAQATGHSERALTVARQARSYAQQSGNDEAVLHAAHDLVQLLADLGSYEEALALHGEASEQAAQSEPYLRDMWLSLDAKLQDDLGRADPAEERLRQRLDYLSGRTGTELLRLRARGDLISFLDRHDRRDEAFAEAAARLAAAESLYERQRSGPNKDELSSAMGQYGWQLMGRDQHQDALRVYRDRVELLADSRLSERVGAAIDLAEVHLSLDQPDEALEETEQLWPQLLGHAPQPRYEIGRLGEQLARIYATLDRASDALDVLDTASTAYEQLSDRDAVGRLEALRQDIEEEGLPA